MPSKPQADRFILPRAPQLHSKGPHVDCTGADNYEKLLHREMVMGGNTGRLEDSILGLISNKNEKTESVGEFDRVISHNAEKILDAP